MECFGEILDMVRRKGPVVHSITNYVTVNDCANIILAAGGSPIMADDAAEVEQIVALSSALVINIGTLNERTVASMLAAGKRANALNIPVVLDPVGAGASDLRNDTLRRLLQDVRFAVIKGNSSEIRFLAGEKATARGVDSDEGVMVSEGNISEAARMASSLSAATGAVVVVSGRIDIVAHTKGAWAVSNGDPLMTRVTGTGCMTAAIVGCCVGRGPNRAAPGQPVRGMRHGRRGRSGCRKHGRCGRRHRNIPRPAAGCHELHGRPNHHLQGQPAARGLAVLPLLRTKQARFCLAHSPLDAPEQKRALSQP